MNFSGCYSVTRCGVAKIYSALVAVRLLYRVKPINFEKIESGLFSQSGSHEVTLFTKEKTNIKCLFSFYYTYVSCYYTWGCFHCITVPITNTNTITITIQDN